VTAPAIRALIVDDEPLARRGIRQLLAREPDVSLVRECRDGREALARLDADDPNLVFLDVQMPELDGFDVIRMRGVDRMPPIVFVTAYDAFAVRAFEAQALDYLVKPLNEARFAATMARVRERHRAGAALELATRLTAMMEILDRTDPSRRAVSEPTFVIPTTGGHVVVHAAEIDWIEADDYYARVHVGSAQHLLRESLSTLERRLDQERFVRVHRGAIVRLDRIREILTPAPGQMLVRLKDGTRVPVGRRRQAQVRALVRGTSPAD
jgi:two-component system LytT family response regulator